MCIVRPEMEHPPPPHRKKKTRFPPDRIRLIATEFEFSFSQPSRTFRDFSGPPPEMMAQIAQTYQDMPLTDVGINGCSSRWKLKSKHVSRSILWHEVTPFDGMTKGRRRGVCYVFKRKVIDHKRIVKMSPAPLLNDQDPICASPLHFRLSTPRQSSDRRLGLAG